VSGGFEQALRGRADAAGISLTDRQVAKLSTYYGLLARWNQTINLTSLALEEYPRLSIDRLLIEPLLAERFFRRPPPRWIDLGTGGGSPAIPLRIIEPAGSLEMIESRERKSAFLREVVRVLQLERTEVRTNRIEDFAASSPSAVADLITMRAVKPTLPIVRAVAHLLASEGCFLAFGGRGLEAEIASWLAQAGLNDTEIVPLLDGHHRLHVLMHR
jgi:16S rRNA (guanine527-N7)-methyltransferase